MKFGANASKEEQQLYYLRERLNYYLDCKLNKKLSKVKAAISVHSPYWSTIGLWNNSIKIAENFKLPIMSHVAETYEEIK